jgi:16S rRNA (cytidine1402-2'-O)-methyltransferase
VKGRIYLVPVTLGDEDFLKVIPERVISLVKGLRFFIAEDIRSARRFLRLIDRSFPINDSVFFELSEHTGDKDIAEYLDPVLKGSDIGLLSEAGLPCIADPGSKIVSMAHEMDITVTPLSGPSSIILALISSGFNGQNFAFNGYLPRKASERNGRIKELEVKASGGYAQIFMETPYRNQQMLESVLSVCQNETKLCIAENITLANEQIRTKKIRDWKKNPPSLNDKLVVFIIQ